MISNGEVSLSLKRRSGTRSKAHIDHAISFANPKKWSRYGIYRWLEVRDEVDEEEAQTAITAVHPVGPVRTG